MAIIEFAYLQLPPNIVSSSPELLKNLVEVKSVIESESHDTTSFFKDVQDEHRMYVIGGWPSQVAHQHGFDGSTKQAQIIDLIKDQMDITWMNYCDVPYSQMPVQDSNKLLCAIVFEFHSFMQNSEQQKQNIESALQDAMKDTRGTRSWNLKKKDEKEDDVIVVWREWKDQETDLAKSWAKKAEDVLAGDRSLKGSATKLMKIVDL